MTDHLITDYQKYMLLSLLSALLLILSFPNFNLNYLSFIGFIPLFFAIENKSPKKAFFISYLCGFLFYLGVLYWIGYVTVIGLVILCLYLALYFGILGFLFYQLSTINYPPSPKKKLHSRYASADFLNFHTINYKLFIIPAIWILLEYLQAHLFTGFGWLLLGYSQYKNLPLIQIADFSGVYGVSFVIVMVNVAVYKMLKKSFREIIIAAVVLIAVIGYGKMRGNEGKWGGPVRVSVIQGNIPQELKWDPDASDMILNKYSVLTKMAALDRPDLIIWPETSFPGFFETDIDLTNKVIDLVKEIKTSLLIGANTERDSKYFNSAILISANGKVVNKYDKIHLVPFGEFVPFSNKLPILHNLILGQLGEFTPGSEFKIFKLYAPRSTLYANFSVLICYEDIFPELAKRFVKNGARFLVVITNDAWYGKSGAAYQHAACSVFRAIENRVPVIRCANTGYSCFIDKKGKIYDAVEEDGTHLFMTGYKTAEVVY